MKMKIKALAPTPEEYLDKKVAKLQDLYKTWDMLIAEKRKQMETDKLTLELFLNKRDSVWNELLDTQQDPLWKNKFPGPASALIQITKNY